MDLKEQYIKICQSVDNVETLYHLPCVEVERNFLILMSLYDQAADYEEDSDVMGEWMSAMKSNIELAFYKREFFSQEFIAYYEAWYGQDERLGRVILGSEINDYCVSEQAYEMIKKIGQIFSYTGMKTVQIFGNQLFICLRDMIETLFLWNVITAFMDRKRVLLGWRSLCSRSFLQGLSEWIILPFWIK